MPKRKQSDRPRLPRAKTPPPSKKRRPATPEHPSSPLAHEWKTPTINRVKALHDAGLSAEDIRRKEGVPRATQYRMFNDPERRPGKTK